MILQKVRKQEITQVILVRDDLYKFNPYFWQTYRNAKSRDVL